MYRDRISRPIIIINTNKYHCPFIGMFVTANCARNDGTLGTQHNNLYNQLEQAGMNRAIIDYIFSLLVGFTLNQANTNQSAVQIYQAFQRQVPWLGLLLRQMNVPQNVADRVFTRVIELTLNDLGQGGRSTK